MLFNKIKLLIKKFVILLYIVINWELKKDDSHHPLNSILTGS